MGETVRRGREGKKENLAFLLPVIKPGSLWLVFICKTGMHLQINESLCCVHVIDFIVVVVVFLNRIQYIDRL